MANLEQIVDQLSALTVIEAAQLKPAEISGIALKATSRPRVTVPNPSALMLHDDDEQPFELADDWLN